MRKIALFAAVVLVASACGGNGQPSASVQTTETLTIHNPVIGGFHPDPSICRAGEDYYLVNSSFQYFPGVPVYHSKDLVNWELIGNVLERESQLPLEWANSGSGIFAPTIRYHEGTFYMITTNISYGAKNFYVTATDPAGPWSEPVYLDQGGIDPSFLFEDGKCYFVSNPNGIMLCEIDIASGKQLTESKLLWNGTGGRYPEGPHIYKIGDWYYLLISEGGTELAHGLTIARSRNIYGPYESNPANPILTHCRMAGQGNQIQGTGHGDLVQAPDGSWWVVFLGYRRYGGDHHHLGRETFLAPVTWENGWPVINGGQPVEAIMDVPATWSADAPQPKTWTEEFDSPLGPQWVCLQNPVPDHYQLHDGILTLRGTTPLKDNNRPTYAGVRQESPGIVVETQVKVRSGEAGLTVYQNQNGFISIGVKDGRAFLRTQIKSLEAVLKEVPVKGHEVLLRIESADGNTYRFFADGLLLGELETSLLSSETIGGFTGVTIGLYAVDGQADFSWYSYKETEG